MNRNRIIAILMVAALSCSAAIARPSDNGRRNFRKNFSEATLRVDFSIDWENSAISVDTLIAYEGWGGRRVNMNTVLYRKDLEFSLTDSKSGKVIYMETKFSDTHGFLLMPLPKHDVTLRIAECGPGGEAYMEQSCPISAAQLRSMVLQTKAPETEVICIRKASISTAVNVAIISEGYTAEEMDDFMMHANMFADTLFSQPAFGPREEDFNIYAVQIPSPESGVTVPSQGIRVNTPFNSTFDSFGMERLLTIPRSQKIADAIIGVPAVHVIVIANSTKYGGSGSGNSYCIGSSGDPLSYRVLVHEFGHSFGFLGDEYESDGFEDSYPTALEPDEPNLTSLVNFSGKWENLVEEGTAGLIEGGGYKKTGIWRGCDSCMMRSLDADFCPVCCQAIGRLVDFYTRQK